MRLVSIVGGLAILGIIVFSIVSFLTGSLGDSVLGEMRKGTTPIYINVSPLGSMSGGDSNTYAANTPEKQERILKNATEFGYTVEKQGDIWVLRKETVIE